MGTYTDDCYCLDSHCRCGWIVFEKLLFARSRQSGDLVKFEKGRLGWIVHDASWVDKWIGSNYEDGWIECTGSSRDKIAESPKTTDRNFIPDLAKPGRREWHDSVTILLTQFLIPTENVVIGRVAGSHSFVIHCISAPFPDNPTGSRPGVTNYKFGRIVLSVLDDKTVITVQAGHRYRYWGS